MHVRRLPVAILLAFAVAAAGVAATGAVQDQPDGASAFLVPAVRDGDQGMYLSQDGEELRFRFTGETWVSPSGQAAGAMALAQERTDELMDSYWAKPKQTKHWFNGMQVVASMHVAGGEFTGVGYTGEGVTDLHLGQGTAGAVGYFEAFEVVYDATDLPFCGLVHSLQGLAATGASLTSPGCSTPLERQAGHVATNVTFGLPGEHVVLDPFHSVPVTIEVNHILWTLAAFHPGQAMPSTAAGPRYDTAFASGSYPDESTIDHVFPLSDALTAALERRQPSAFSDVLARPGAYLAEASYVEVVERGNHRLTWALTAWDGSQAGAVNVTLVKGDPEDGTYLPPAPTPIFLDLEDPGALYPDTTAPRSPFPTLRSLTTRWEVAIPISWQGQGLNAWGFTFGCDLDCGTSQLTTWVGTNMRQEISGEARLAMHEVRCVLAICNPVSGIRYALVQDILQVDGTGNTTRLRHTDWVIEDQANVAVEPLVIEEGREEGAIDTGGRGGPGAVAWSAPGPEVVAGLTMLGIAVGLLYQFWPALKGGVLGLLRSFSALPENAIRLEVRQAIDAAPGIHFHALRRTTGKAAGTLRHHLRVLEDQGDIIAHEQGGYKCYFPARGTDRHLVASAGALKAPSARRMLHGIVQAGHLSMGEAAVFAGLTPSTATHHALRLEEAGLVTRTRSGRTIELRPTVAAMRALDSAGAA